ncbi:MAG: GspH/FimT family pseudopilin [Gammaproteobacteria bacterium]|nr:GspH/FimT family pseudopilin [Gammaproteobacteria bacterium]
MATVGTAQTGGFTLFEILIVLALIGIMLAVLVPRLGHATETSARTQALRLCALMKAARTQAILSGDPCLVKPATHGYAFLRMNRRGHFVAMAGRLFRARTLPSGARLEGFGVRPVVFHASGLVRPFHWTLVTAHGRWRLAVGQAGRVQAHVG